MLFSVYTSPHFVSCTIQCEETGFHFLSARLFEEAVYAVAPGRTDWSPTSMLLVWLTCLSFCFRWFFLIWHLKNLFAAKLCENREFLFLIYDLIQKHDLYTVFITLLASMIMSGSSKLYLKKMCLHGFPLSPLSNKRQMTVFMSSCQVIFIHFVASFTVLGLISNAYLLGFLPSQCPLLKNFSNSIIKLNSVRQT